MFTTPTVTAAPPAAPPRPRPGLLIAGCLAVAAATAAGTALLVPTRTVIAGLPDAGPVVAVALPMTRAGFHLTGALTVGWLLAAAWLVPPQRSGVLDVGGYRAIRAAGWCAAAWAALAVLLLPLTVLDVAGRSPDFLLTYPDRLIVAVGALDQAKAVLITAVVAAVIAVAARFVLRPGGAWWLLVLAGVALLPQAVTGHSAQDRDHDIAVDGMIFHLVGLSVWVGGLIVVLVLAARRTPHLPVIARRYSTAALVGFTAVVASGLINTVIRVTDISDLWGTSWGRLLLVKTALVVGLLVLGLAHRRRTLPALQAGTPGAFRRLAGGEIPIMAATLGLGVALGRTAPPPSATAAPPGDIERVLGFALDGPPNPLTLLTQWRMDWLLGTAALVMAVGYLIGVRRLRSRGITWPLRRSFAWLAGCLTVLVATSSGLGRYAEAQFSIHMLAHMLLGMTAPALLVLGAPITLALRALPPAPRGGPPGLRELIVSALHSRIARLITHPLFVLALFIASLPAVYFSPVFDFLISTHLGHLTMNLHYLAVGYLYYSVVIGVDPLPRRLPFIAKFGLLLAPIPFHSFSGIAMMMTSTPRAVDYYTTLGLPWVPDLAADQRLGGAIAWAAVEAPLALVVFALIAQWSSSDEREARRADRRGYSRDDDELAAYNRMLAALNGTHPNSAPHAPNIPHASRPAAPPPAVIPAQPRPQGPS